MKKILFVMAALFGCFASSRAQSTLVATLSHGNDVSMYYGAYALRDALEKAESGDIINLSDGAFQAADITKAITLRGAGIDAAKPTYIVNQFTINIPTDDGNRFTMEGIRCNDWLYLDGKFSDPCFVKCILNGFDICWNYRDNDFIENVMFANCKIIREYHIYHGTAQFVNCYLDKCINIDSGSAATFLNCVMNQDYEIYALSFSQLFNSIICYKTDYVNTNVIPSSSTASNCIAIGYNNPFEGLTSSPNCTVSTFAEVFKNYTGEYSDGQTFELTDAAKAKFLGTDGTQVGVYGGVLPYTSTPSYPQFTKMVVDGKTTTDGKLGVNIEVAAGK